MNQEIQTQASEFEGGIPQIPEAVRNALPTVYIFSVAPKPFSIGKGGRGTIYIPACEPGQRVSKPYKVDGMQGLHDYRAGLILTFDPGMDVAKDIVGCHPNSQDRGIGFHTANYEWHGVFITTNEVPTDAEIEAAKAKRKERNLFIIAEADQSYLRGQMELIYAAHREACFEEGLKREWANKPVTLDSCPACGSDIKPNIAICPRCQAILREDLARKFFPERFAQPTPEPEPVKVARK